MRLFEDECFRHATVGSISPSCILTDSHPRFENSVRFCYLHDLSEYSIVEKFWPGTSVPVSLVDHLTFQSITCSDLSHPDRLGCEIDDEHIQKIKP